MLSIAFATVAAATVRTMGESETKEWRKKRMGELAEKVGGNAALGALMGYKSGHMVWQMREGLRPVTEKTVAKAEAVRHESLGANGARGWFAMVSSQAPPPPVPAPGAAFDALTADEWDMLNNYRKLLDKDRKRFDQEISALAQERQAEFDEFNARFGVRAAANANARRSRTATAGVDPKDQRIKQKQLFGDKGRRS